MSHILRVWEADSRREVESARDKDSRTVRNELTHFLDALAIKLESERTEMTDKEATSAQHHGQQRAGLTKYTLVEIIREYALLRRVIVDYLGTGPLSELERQIIHASVDHAIEMASNEFAQAEQSQIKLALAKAESSNRDLDQFAAVAAHDLRAPLATIAGFAEILRDDVGPNFGESRQHLDYIIGAVGRMTSMIDGILSYSKLVATPAAFGSVSCDEALKSAIQNLKAAITEASGRIGHQPMPEVDGNLPLLSQLFQNLFANALKFRSARPPEIEVSVEAIGLDWTFQVRDNGIGFDPADAGVIFDVHKQLNTSRRDAGAGLGLATCRRIVEIHNGRIWAESTPGEGSRFYFTLPRAGRRP